MKVLAIGSEAVIMDKGNTIVKIRKRKGYRIKDLDEKLRKRRTKAEFNIMKKLYENGVKVPKPISIEENKKEINMEKIIGKRLSEQFEINDSSEIGRVVAEMHNVGVIHGDLTTANMVKNKEGIFLIDFGLSYYSGKDEDIASDLFLFKNALKSKHNDLYKEAYSKFLDEYKRYIRKEFKGIDTHLKDIERRRRYNESY